MAEPWIWLLGTSLGLLLQTSSAQACTVPHWSNPNHVLEGVDLQYKLLRFFDGKGPPPLEEVFFTTQNLSRAVQDELLKDCPGLLVNSFIVLAEVSLPVAPEESAAALAKAEELAERLSKEEYEAAVEAWPILPALSSYRRAAAAVEAAPQRTLSVDIVVCHCGESLDWLVDGRVFMPAVDSAAVDVYIYEKCSKPTDVNTSSASFRHVYSIPVKDGDIRRDECSAYLKHLVDRYSDPADYTFFFQADAGDHMQWEYLSLVMRSISLHTLQAPFVHLNHPRLVASLSPCREEVFRHVFGRRPRQMLGSYCCAQFAVARERVLANPLERYERMQQMLFGDSPSECHDIPGHSTHCLMYEVYWHVLFGEQDDLPERAANPALPLFLRIRDLENESYLPPGSLYLQHIQEV
eukprot:CAMPEP_0175338580 /NCGR_PEP_ID=MMETSP0095-20121207/4906_1 /TAXON_ID=311494 /ORGANISM="Alexandrium monilatum, Strain CCMP3105" /LENGTH=407 /DNA_ID=CAMNT_0016635983 /DNA_START=34 /DNA_END=1257 /DNA_ORIENTATION=-